MQAPSQADTERPAGSLIPPVTTTEEVVASDRKSDGSPARTLVDGSQTSWMIGVRNPVGPITKKFVALTVPASMAPLNGTVTRGRRSKASCRLSKARSSQTEEFIALQAGTGRFTRRPVIWAGSGTVKLLLGMIRVSGVEPVITLTDVSAETATGTSEATTKMLTSRERDFWTKPSLQSHSARVYRGAAPDKPPDLLEVPEIGGPGWDRTNDQPIMRPAPDRLRECQGVSGVLNKHDRQVVFVLQSVSGGGGG